jgi:hypothetical protein
MPAGYQGAACDVTTSAPNDNSPMGMNVGGLAYWSTQWVFVDVMKQSSKWWTQRAWPGRWGGVCAGSGGSHGCSFPGLSH